MTQAEVLALFDQYHNMVYRLALAVTHSPQDADDVTQTVFLKLLDGRPGPAHGKERAWLTKVTVNACRDLMRSFWWRKTAPLEEVASFSSMEEWSLFDAVMTLPPKYSVVTHLHYYEGYSCAEIGDMLHLRPSTVSMRLYRARAMLRNKLKEEYYETFVSANL